MHDTQLRINQAVAAGALDDVKMLRNQMKEINFALGTILDHQVAQIDNSETMKKAISAFASVNKAITTELSKLQDLQKFITALNSLLGNLNTAVGIALKKAAPGGAAGGGTPAAGGSG
jgi:ATP-dependent Lon protease